MKISIEHNDGRAFSIKFPNWLILSRLGIGIAAKSIVKQDGSAISVKIGNADIEEKQNALIDKKEFKLAVKKMKLALLYARREFCSFLKRNPVFLFIDVVGEDGECVKISF
ncbi:MAG: hypothetical protein IJW38_02990 [Clostridia bacterium]|nr:hypothetical protein [Clostridia bacterium]